MLKHLRSFAKFSQLRPHGQSSSKIVRSFSSVGGSQQDEGVQEGVGFIESKEDFKWVERMLPPSRIPKPPKHASYPTPSGWFPPSETPPDKPYYVSRNRYHTFPVKEVKETIQFETPRIPEDEIEAIEPQILTTVTDIEGDLFALAEDLVEAVRPYSEFDPVASVDESNCIVYVKGQHGDVVRDFLGQSGF